MTHLYALLAFSFLCFLFWQHRKQAELAKWHISHKCKELELQLVSISFARQRFFQNRKWMWHTRYEFEFSAMGDDCYQGYLDMQGFHPRKFYFPPYRI